MKLRRALTPGRICLTAIHCHPVESDGIAGSSPGPRWPNPVVPMRMLFKPDAIGFRCAFHGFGADREGRRAHA